MTKFRDAPHLQLFYFVGFFTGRIADKVPGFSGSLLASHTRKTLVAQCRVGFFSVLFTTAFLPGEQFSIDAVLNTSKEAISRKLQRNI
jgi:hypothetical protein